MSLTILLIEDDHDLRETTLDYLKDENFNTLSAENGAQGIQLAIQHIPDVILCDINMPGLSGYEVYNMLHQVTTTSIIPFIFLSAKSSRDEILTGLHLGVDDYITKPFDFQELVEVIRKRVDRRNKIVDQEDEKFKVLFENTHTAAFILIRNTFEYANKALLKLLGYDFEELKGLSITNILHRDSLSIFNAAVDQCRDGIKKSFNLSISAIHKINGVRELDLMGSQINFKGQLSLICTVTEINNDISVDSEPKLSPTGKVHISDREVEVLSLICEGLTNSEIGEKLFLSERTVEGHRSRLFLKTGTKNSVALAMWAVKHNYYSKS
jgi:PAS domain S-box-containing protein